MPLNVVFIAKQIYINAEYICISKKNNGTEFRYCYV